MTFPTNCKTGEYYFFDCDIVYINARDDKNNTIDIEFYGTPFGSEKSFIYSNISLNMDFKGILIRKATLVEKVLNGIKTR